MLNCIVFGTQSSVQRVWYRDYLIALDYMKRLLSIALPQRGGTTVRRSEMIQKQYSSNISPVDRGGDSRRQSSSLPLQDAGSVCTQPNPSKSVSSAMSRSNDEDREVLSSTMSILSDSIRDNSIVCYHRNGSGTSRDLSASHDIESIGCASTRVVGFATNAMVDTLDAPAEIK